MNTEDWTTANQRVLVAEFARLGAQIGGEDSTEAERSAEAARAAMPAPAAIDTLTQAIGLSGFERDVLLLCAGVVMDGRVRAACAAQTGNSLQTYATFDLALEKLAEPHWSALTPLRPLRRLRMIDVRDEHALTASPLSVDERLLHYLAGVNCLDTRLAAIVRACAKPQLLAETHEAAIETAATGLDSGRAKAVVQVVGQDVASHREVARRLSAKFGLQLHELNAHDIPASADDAEALAALWHRESLLLDSALLLHVGDSDPETIARFLERLSGLVLVSSAHAPDNISSDVSVRIDKLDALQRKRIWSAILGDTAQHLNGSLDEVCAHFELGTGEIIRTASELRAMAAEPRLLEDALWQSCRNASRRSLDDLAHRIESRARWRDLVLPDSQYQMLHELASQVRHRFTVYERWGFAERSARGLGISALFSGESGTGKTMAAEVLAQELRLDLYRIDLASMVSKYIGETEKNLRRIFDAAETSGAILLFDEADALFGRRGEVRESHDRFANVEVSYLLQRMEAYRGLAILTTNLQGALDTAFQRRLRFVVQFAFPDVQLRERIWRGAFPAEVPLGDINYLKLAQLNVAGGDIRNIAINAAFLAAADDHPLSMGHLLSAARREANKRERPFSDAEVRGWS